MEDDSFLQGLPALSDLSDDADTRYAELEEILGRFRPHLDAAIRKVEAHSFDAMRMAFEFFPQRKAGFGMKKEWPFTIDEHGRALVVGGVLDIKAHTPELAEAYRIEYLELVAAKMPQHMQNCRDLEELFQTYGPYAKDMVFRYAIIDPIVENRGYHDALAAVGKEPLSITFQMSMISEERNFYCTHGNPAEFSSKAYQAQIIEQFKCHNIYLLDHPSDTITSEDLLRYAPALMKKRYHSLQDEAWAIKKELERLGPGAAAKSRN